VFVLFFITFFSAFRVPYPAIVMGGGTFYKVGGTSARKK